MSDDLTPQQTDAVRRALRAARHDAPLPDDVAARLDATLAGLVADRAAGEPALAAVAAAAPADGSDRVVPLRRRWPAFLAAAAAVTAIGLVGTQYLDRGAGDSGAFSSADGSAPEASALTESRDDAEAAPDALDGDLLGTLNRSLTPIRLTPAQRAALADDGYRRIELAPELIAGATDSGRSAAKSLDSLTADAYAEQRSLVLGCALPDLSLPGGVTATYYLARHGGERVALVVLPGPEVTAYPCDGGEPTRLPLD